MSAQSLLLADARRVCDAIDLTPLTGKNVLITGATGVVGTCFLASLVELTRRGIGPGLVVAVSRSGVVDHLSSMLLPNFKVITVDMSKPFTLSGLPVFDFIIHGAGYGQPGLFMENPVATIALNTTGTLSLFESLAKGGRFLFLSTSEVYSGIDVAPHREDQIGNTNTNHPRSCYIEAKRCGEAICNAYRTQGVAAKSARLALAYGPGTRPGDKRVLNSFIQKGIEQGEIEMMDTGSASRTYVYVSDAVEMMWSILLYGKESIYNVGGTSRTTIVDLARKIGKILGVSVIVPTASKELVGAPGEVWLDLSKTLGEFGKRHFVTMEEGLAATIKWQQELYRSKR